MSLRSEATPRLAGPRGPAWPRGLCVDCGETMRAEFGLALVAGGEAAFPECVRAAVGFAGGM
jgi:hypothetical protein